MTRISVETAIDAPPAEVWAHLEQLEHHVDWMADAVAITFESASTRGIGTRFVCDTRVGPLRLSDRMEVVEWRPPAAMGVRHTGLVTGTGRFSLTKHSSGGTVLRWDEDLTFPWYLGGVVAGAVGGQAVLRRIWRRNLDHLRRLVEADDEAEDAGSAGDAEAPDGQPEA